MVWKNIRLVFFREVRDQLRDRRTLFMVAVLPILLYPLLAIAMVQMTVSFEEQRRTVLMVGAEELPGVPLLEGDRFLPDYFRYPDDADKLRVVTDVGLRQGSGEAEEPLRAFLEKVQEEMPLITRVGEVEQQIEQLTDRLRSGEAQVQSRLNALEAELKRLRVQLGEWFASAPCEVLIVFPEGFAADVEQAVPQNPAGGARGVATSPRPAILHNSADEKSQIAYDRVREVLRSWERVILIRRLEQAGLPRSLPYPVDAQGVDLAKPAEVAASTWSKIFPALLVIMSVTGAFYPAIDLGAGEKERGTMETLLISPATRTEIVLGKFLTVMLFSISTALLNLCSMGFTGKHMLGLLGKTADGSIGSVSFPPISSLMWVFFLAVPLAALFSALSLAFAMFARSSKEGQYYLTPLLMVTMVLTMFCLNPAVELTPYYSTLPVIGPALLLKALLLHGTGDGLLWTYGLPVLGSSIAYSLVALWWAIELFQREDILFREAEKLDVGVWMRHLMRDKEPVPSMSEAAFCFVLIALAQFAFLTTMQSAIQADGSARSILTTQLIYLVATVGVPPLLMAILLTTSVRKSLKLHWPGWKMMVIGGLLPVGLMPLARELLAQLDWFFPNLPPGAEQLMAAMGSAPLAMALGTFALAPAICEELAFRGFIFTGLQRSRHKWLPVVVSAVLFGVIHLIPQQVFNATLLGLVLGLLVLRSGSLLPGVLFHAAFNGLEVLLSRLPRSAWDSDVAQFLCTIEVVEGQIAIHFDLPLLAAAAALSGLLLAWLWRSPAPRKHAGVEIAEQAGTLSTQPSATSA